MSAWEQITCEEREALIDFHGRSYSGFSAESGIGVLSGSTDVEGLIFTEWGFRDTDEPVLQDYRWHESYDRSCEHYVWRGDDR